MVSMSKKELEIIGDGVQNSFEEFRTELSFMYPELTRWELLIITDFIFWNDEISYDEVLKSLKYLSWKVEETTTDLKELVDDLKMIDNIQSDIGLSEENISILIKKLKYRGITDSNILSIFGYGDGADVFENACNYCDKIEDSATKYLVAWANAEEE